MRARFEHRLFLLMVMLVALRLAAQTAPETAPTPATVEEALHQMADEAGVIFAGEVVAIRQVAGERGASGVVEVSFRVDEAVRGCAAGQGYVLREWAGLWEGGEPRYRVGQQLLMLLHAPGASGISSPVGGMDGAIPLRATTPVVGQASGATAGTAVVADLRWVGTRIVRSPQTVSGGLTGIVTGAGAPAGEANPADSSTAMQQATVSTVVGMLRGWAVPRERTR